MNIWKQLGIMAVMCCMVVCAAMQPLTAHEKRDALQLFRNGRSLDRAGRLDDAKKMYNAAVTVCRNELGIDPRNMDSHTVYTWSLFRLHHYREAIDACIAALKIAPDVRIIETLGEAYFYVNNYKDSLRHMERYIDMAPTGERVSVAYFYAGDIYRLTKRYQKADIAYSAAVHLEPWNSLWWYRLGLAREQAGDKAGAIAAFERAVSVRKDYKEALDAVHRLKG